MKLREALQHHTHCVRCNQPMQVRGGLMYWQQEISLSPNTLNITYTIENYPLSPRAKTVKAYFSVDLLTDNFVVDCMAMPSLHQTRKQCYLICECPTHCYSYNIASDFNYITNVVEHTQISLEQVILRDTANTKWVITQQDGVAYIDTPEITDPFANPHLSLSEVSLGDPDLLEQIKTLILFS